MTTYNSNSGKTHVSLKAFLLLTGIISLLSLGCTYYFSFSPFLLTREGLEHFYLWQPITFLLVIPGTQFTFFYFLTLGIKLLITWGLSYFLIEKKGVKLFWISIGFNVLILSSSSLVVSWMFSSTTPFAGNNLLVSSLAVGYFIWSSPKLKLPIPLHISIQGRWIILALLFIILGEEFLQNDIAYHLVLGVQLIGSYLLEKKLSKKGSSKRTSSSLFFKTQKAIESIAPPIAFDDEIFIEAVLSKISLYGERMLTPEERNRMDRISIKKEITKNFPF